jgi:hypothetical protein
MISQLAATVKRSERWKAILEYLNKGFSIIPVGDDKKPLVAWKEYQDRRAGEDELTAWWSNWPGANIGIVTGKISGITVIDCDTPEAVAELEETLPDSFLCPIVETPRGGRHYYFSYQPDLKTGAEIMPGVDVRNDGGYVVAPPSMTPRGIYRLICKGP